MKASLPSIYASIPQRSHLRIWPIHGGNIDDDRERVDHGLGINPGNSGAADVLNFKQVVGQRAGDLRGRLRKRQGSSRIVGNEED